MDAMATASTGFHSAAGAPGAPSARHAPGIQGSYGDTTVIIPTLNERGNITGILSRLVRTYRGIRVTVTDDGSTDGTRELVAQMARLDGAIRLVDRSRCVTHGYTASVLDAVLLTKTEKLIVMDADMQHPVEKVGEIAGALGRHGLVIAVRTRISDWGLLRREMSKAGRYAAFAVFKIRGKPTCHDMMSGFFGANTELFKGLIAEDRGRFVERGSKLPLDLLREVGNRTAIAEVPYSTFGVRENGESKMEPRQIGYVIESIFKR
jgi:dolichol-phosphate mannosyltransferase